MPTVRGYFDKTLGNGVLRVEAQVEYAVSFLLYNSDAQDLVGSISVPPSDRVGAGAVGAPRNGMAVRVPGVSNLALGPFSMHAGEMFELNLVAIRAGSMVNSLVWVTHDEPDETAAQVAMSE